MRWPGAKKIKQSTGSGGDRMLCRPWFEVARSQKIQQSTGHWQEVRCAGHGVRWPGAKKINQPLAGSALC